MSSTSTPQVDRDEPTTRAQGWVPSLRTSEAALDVLTQEDEAPTTPPNGGELESAATPSAGRELHPGVLAALRQRGREQLRAVFIPKHEWIGRVEAVADDHFEALLASRARPGEEERTEIWLDEISPKDLDSVRVGAVFYWVVGYRDESWGQRRAVSSIRFRHVLPLSDDESDEAREAGVAMRSRANAD